MSATYKTLKFHCISPPPEICWARQKLYEAIIDILSKLTQKVVIQGTAVLRNQVQDCSTSLFLTVPLHLERAYGYPGRWCLTDEYYPSFWNLPWCFKLSELSFWTWRNVTEVFQLFFYSERFQVFNQLTKGCIEKPGVFQSQPPPSRGRKCHSSGARFK